ncbi:Cyclohexanone monooxygenase [Lasiodiplodia theobromae]|uniref:Cyclohexanone monooxygenase n=1 Tax=Lasiodiplodia theobromae TaxID=45133 RepID=UPI0015C40611|nr:Cyclohexanone monooxygenase [Lasiodiplodia theobromae]KAF4540715.1 Cyclohexanone monooxygenase [Lasiodiplodia theobromae]
MPEIHVDALIVGAGLGGIYQCYRLRQLGLVPKVIDMAGDVGGTWYWNRYPGAMSDTESYLYRFSWDAEDLQTYPWTHHYLQQSEILAYIHHVVDKHDLRKHIQFNTEMVSAEWIEARQHWRVECATGDVFIARYLVTALGLLSKRNFPDIPGIADFQGVLMHTASWNPIDLSGKRVGVIGNGSTGTQLMTAIAPVVKQLVSFQRHPQYSVPNGNKPVSPEYRKWVNDHYDEIWKQAFESSTAFGVVESTRPTMSVSAEERQKIFQELWDQGNGFRFMFGGFGDITTSEEANEEACRFIRQKIAEIVKDPVKAKALQPTDYYAKRPLCNNGYYEIFNRDNVDLVDLKATPIAEITAGGIRTSETLHELDVIVFATGFDAIDGNYTRICIRGLRETIKEHWDSGATSYLGLSVAGFPNFFMISGPQGPFCNIPPAIESFVDFITAAIQLAEQNRLQGGRVLLLEPSLDAESEWGKLCDRLTEGSLFKKTSSWIFGTNVSGRQERTKFYFGGLKQYREVCRRVMEGGFQEFLESRKEPAAIPFSQSSLSQQLSSV